MKATITIIMLLGLLFPSCLLAQIKITGRITDNNGASRPFVPVALLDAADTTKIISGSITDIEGNYIIKNVRPGTYHIVVSQVGCETIREQVRLALSSDLENCVRKNFAMADAAVALGEVTVAATKKQIGIDKSVHIFSAEQKQKAMHSADLVRTVEDLKIDPQTGGITRMGGGGVKILVNGVHATSSDPKSLPPDKIKSIDYYRIPPARYAEGNTVLIDVKTKELDTGISGGIDMLHAVEEGFFIDKIFMRHNFGRHQLVMDYGIDFRDYTERHETRKYHFFSDQMHETYESEGNLGYTTHVANLKYIYNVPEKTSLQIVVGCELNDAFDNADQQISTEQGQLLQNRTGREENESKTANPSVDIYYSRKFGNQTELSANVVGAMHSGSQSRLSRETGEAGLPVYTDNMESDVDKYSAIGELVYGNSIFSTGYKGTYSTARSETGNTLSGNNVYDYNARSQLHKAYAEFTAGNDNLLLRAGMGCSYAHLSNDNVTYDKCYFNPSVTCSVMLSDNHRLQYVLQSEPEVPTISQLSDNATQITSRLLRVGNPYLASSNVTSQYLMYEYVGGWLNISVALAHQRTMRPIDRYYGTEDINGREYVVQKHDNGKKMVDAGGVAMLELKPFGDALSTRLMPVALKQTLTKKDGVKYSHWTTPLYIEAGFEKGNWHVSYSGSVVSKAISGQLLQDEENESNLTLAYKHKNMKFSAGCLYMFTKAKYWMETLPNDIMSFTGKSHIDDNKSMITIGFAWNFTKGFMQDVDKKLTNKDTDNGLF